MNRLSTGLLWIGALIIAIVPGIVALDSGGILAWSYWALSAAVILPAFCGLAAFRKDLLPTGVQPHLLTVGLLFLGGFALFQSVSLPAGLTKILSPGSYAAWSEWLPEGIEQVDASGAKGWMSISIAPSMTRAYAWTFFSMAGFAWCGSMLFSSRGRLMWLLLAIAILGAVHALLGLWQVFLFPDRTIWGIQSVAPFGAFVNRNNSAAIMVISLACSLGLVGWRLAAVTGHEFGEKGFAFSAILDLISDKPSVLGLGTAAINIAGLLSCGSRGGLAGAIAGLVVAMGLFGSARILQKLLWALVLGIVLAFVLLARTDVSPRTLDRFGASAQGLTDSILTDGRIPHWQDSFDAVSEYLPAGSGFGTYRYAYLPYEKIGADVWFLNADNLWLEWLMEGGLISAICLCLLFGALVYALVQLRNTPDPMDHGIATAGWMALVGILVSQTFDFGLTLAGSGAAFSLLMGTVLGRAATEGLPLFKRSKEAGDRLQFEADYRPIAAYIVAPFIIVCLIISLSGTSAVAREDSIIRSAREVDQENSVAGDDAADDAIGDAIVKLQSLVDQETDNANVFYEIAMLEAKIAASVISKELVESKFALPGTLLQVKPAFQIYRQIQKQHSTEPNPRLEILINTIQSKVEPHIVALRSALTDSLLLCPLSPEPRFLAIIAETDLELSPAYQHYSSQLLALRRFSGNPLGLLANLAGERNDWETATQALRNIATNSPRRIVALLRTAEQMGHPRPSQLVPDDDEAMMLAARDQIRTGKDDLEFYQRAVDKLSENFPEDRYDRSNRMVTLARLNEMLGNTEKSFEDYLRAIELWPSNIETRVAYVEALARAGELLQAKRYAEDLASASEKSNERLIATIRRVQRLIDDKNSN